ncbi:MAG: hypothetical protein GY828_07475 [Candidatus Gracilibacteria bacterium]|nr:hypothetical protein [Candidatus Gracilibacteria bacterium]
MDIVDKDNRELTDVSPINYKTDGVIFYDMKITGNFAGDLLDMIKGDLIFVHADTQKISFGDKRIYDMAGNYFVVEYTTDQQINSDIQGVSDTFKYDEKEIFAEKIVEDGNTRQIPEYLGRFEHEGKFYMIINGLNKLTEEITPAKGIYKGVIISSDDYSNASSKIKTVNSKTGSQVDNIIENKKKPFFKGF